MRKSNEVPITVVLLEKMLALGNESRPFRVIKGPDPEARVVDVNWDGDCVVLIYDRPVDEPVLQEFRIDLQLVPDGQEQGLEKLRRVARDIEQR